MGHWRKLHDREWIFALDLDGKDRTLTIEKIVQGTLKDERGKKSKKPVAFFKESKPDEETGKKKGLALNITNCKVIAKLYGDDTDNWLGKQITIYPTTTEMAGETKDCIRVRPRIPSARIKSEENGQASPPEPEPPPQPEAREPGVD